MSQDWHAGLMAQTVETSGSQFLATISITGYTHCYFDLLGLEIHPFHFTIVHPVYASLAQSYILLSAAQQAARS